jgi:hypothetical protein
MDDDPLDTNRTKNILKFRGGLLMLQQWWYAIGWPRPVFS